MQRHSVSPDGSPALDDDKRAAGDVGQRGERLGGGDGGDDGDGVDDWGRSHFLATLQISNSSTTLSANLGLFRK